MIMYEVVYNIPSSIAAPVITSVLLEMYVLTLMIKKFKDTIYIVMKT